MRGKAPSGWRASNCWTGIRQASGSATGTICTAIRGARSGTGCEAGLSGWRERMIGTGGMMILRALRHTMFSEWVAWVLLIVVAGLLALVGIRLPSALLVLL